MFRHNRRGNPQATLQTLLGLGTPTARSLSRWFVAPQVVEDAGMSADDWGPLAVLAEGGYGDAGLGPGILPT